jgi:hypothetical protein
MAYLPCTNPSCKSYGKPHPNCKDYDGLGAQELQSLESQGWELPGIRVGKQPKKMAEGGEASHCCASDVDHQPHCQYYDDGGDVAPDWDSMSTTPPQAAQTPQASETPNWDELSTTAPSSVATPNWDDLSTVSPSEKYGTTGQQLLTGIEGAARGVSAGLSDVAIGGARKLAEQYTSNPDLWAPNMEDVAARERENPTIARASEAAGLIGSLIRGVGIPGLISKGVDLALVPEIKYATKLTMRGSQLLDATFTPIERTVLQKMGSSAVKGAIETSALQTGDEMSKAMLGQGDPEAPVSAALAHIGAAGLFGSITGGVFGGVGAGASKLKQMTLDKMNDKGIDLLGGIGIGALHKEAGSSPEMIEKVMKTLPKYAPGIKMYNEGLESLRTGMIGEGTKLVGGAIGGAIGGWPGAALGYIGAKKALVKPIEWVVDKAITKANKYIPEAVLTSISKSSPQGIGRAVEHAENVSKGAKAIFDGVENIFKVGGQQAIDAYATERDREKLKDFIDKGGVDQQMQNQMHQDNTTPPAFAEGGEVQKPVSPQVSTETDHLANIYPEQSMIMNAAKNRVYNYLNTLKPRDNLSKLPFDKVEPNQEQERKYNRALDMAAKPLGILNHIKTGELTPEHVQHFNAMWPELKSHLDKKLTEKIMESQMKDEKPSYRTRQGLSLFLGSPMDSTFTQPNMAAIQMTFASQKAQSAAQAPVPKNKKGTATLTKVADQYQTQDQAAASRSQKE